MTDAPPADTVLLIADDRDLLRTVGAFLDRTGYEVLRADTAGAGLTSFDGQPPDVVVLDLHLPDRPGLEVLRQLRDRDASVVLLTRDDDVATAVKAMQLGAENFLTKPVDLRHLAAAVARAAEKARLRRQVHEMRNALERAMIMAKGVSAIGDEHPPADLRRGASGLSRHRPQTLKEGERRQVERALEAHRGNRTWAARELGISRVTLLKKIKQYGLD